MSVLTGTPIPYEGVYLEIRPARWQPDRQAVERDLRQTTLMMYAVSMYSRR